MVLIHGDCPTGADKHADDWARMVKHFGHHVIVERYPADWKRFKGAAGYRRNAEMVKRGADVCLAFIYNDSKGASHTLEMAKRAEIDWEEFVKYTHRVVCAVPICNNDLRLDSHTKKKDILNKVLKDNGWQLEFGKWICPDHKTEHEHELSPSEVLQERARELARDIRRASRAFDQVAEIAAHNVAASYLYDLSGTEYEEDVTKAYHEELRRDVPESELPWTCPCHATTAPEESVP